MTTVSSAFSAAQAVSAGATGRAGVQGSKSDYNLFYSIRPGNWYKTFPFYFEINSSFSSDDSSKPADIRFFLPIPPQNMTIQDMSTSEAHATIGGVVEETSQGVFTMITLVGTTGLSSKALDLGTQSTDFGNISFRSYLDDLTGQTNPLTKLIGNVTTGVLNLASGITGDSEAKLPYNDAGSAVISTNAKDDPTGTITSLSVGRNAAAKTSGGGLEGIIGRQASAIANLFTNKPKDFKTPFANGYSWSHALRQMFLIYQREKSKNPELSLTFFDVKANTKYRCVARSVQFTQNVNNPYLINYNIALKCWALDNTGERLPSAEINRFGPDGDLKEVFTGNLTASITKIGSTLKSFQRPGGIAGSMVKNSTSSVI